MSGLLKQTLAEQAGVFAVLPRILAISNGTWRGHGISTPFLQLLFIASLATMSSGCPIIIRQALFGLIRRIYADAETCAGGLGIAAQGCE